MASPLGLSGTAFITGGASGIGLHSALAFAKHGISNLVLADINPKTLSEAVERVTSTCPSVAVLPITLDVLDGAAVKAAVAQAVERFGRLDVAVNSAGVGGGGKPTHEVPEEEWRRVIGVDLDGVWRCQKEELGVMVGQEDLGPRIGRGRIINIASMYGIVGTDRRVCQAAYSAAKAGVVGLTRADGNAYGHLNIRVNAICPGFVGTPFLEAHIAAAGPESATAKAVLQAPLGRLCGMDEIADAIAFLASPMSSFMQGAALVADGGFTAQ